MSSTDFSIAIGANISDFQAGMVGIRNSVSNAVNNINAQFNRFNATISKTKAAGVEMASYVASAFNGWKDIAGLAAKVFAEPLRQFSRYEDAAIRLAPLVGGLDAAKTLTKELRDEAANGYLSLEQLTSIAGRLATVFKSSSEIKQWTSAFHNLAAGTGMDVNELVGNFVKSKASGRFEAGFMDMFAQKGVNIFEPLVAQTGMAEAALRKLATEGKLAFSEIENAILSLSTGTGKFAGQAAALSSTLSGSFGTLKEEFNAVLADFGEKFAAKFTGALQAATAAIKENSDGLATAGSVVTQTAATVAAGVLTFRGATAAIGKMTTALKAMKAGGAAAGLSMATLATGILAVVGAVAAAGAYWYADAKEEEAARLESHIAKTERLNAVTDAVENAATFEELEEQLKAVAQAWEIYAASREKNGIKGGLVKDGFDASVEAAAERARFRLLEEESAYRRARALEAEKKEAEELAAAQAEKQKQEQAIYESKKALFDKSKEHVDMLRAEIEGNAQKIAQLKEQADLAKKVEEFKKAGYDDALALKNAQGIQALEKEKAIADFLRSEKGISSAETLKDKMIGMGINPELAGEYAALKAKASQGGADGNGWGVSFVGTAQAHLGGGGGFSVGENLATSLARESVQVQTRMEKLLEKIAEKHVPSGTAVFN